jgi:hypothetical protein
MGKNRPTQDREPTTMKRLLERLLVARARRDREVRFSEPWQAADAAMHAIERAIFRVPLERAEPGSRDADAPPRDPTPMRRRERSLAADDRVERAG